MRIRSAILAVLVAMACAQTVVAPEARREAPIEPLLSSDEIPGNFLLRQHLRFQWRDRSDAVDAIVQNACGELTILLLSPLGTPALVIQQRGMHVETEQRQGPALPFDAVHILVDVQRTYFVPFAGAPRGGRRELVWRGHRIVESWKDSRLVARSYGPESDGDLVRIAYPQGARSGELPVSATLESDRFQYRMEVETRSRSEIDCAPDGDPGRAPPGS